MTKAWGFWPAAGEASLAKDAESTSRLDNHVHMEIGQLTEKLLSGLNIPGSALAGLIAEQIPIDCIDQSLGDAELVIELAGIAICVLSGNPILGSACFKALIHDLFHRIIVAEIRNLIASGHSEITGSDAPLDPMSRRGKDANYAEDSARFRPGGVYIARRTDGTVGTQSTHAARTADGPHDERIPPSRPEPTVFASDSGGIATEEPGGASRVTRITNVSGISKDTLRLDNPPRQRGPESPEGQETSIAGPREPSIAGHNPNVAAGRDEQLVLVHLRIHYDLLDSAVSASGQARPDRLTRLIIIRESCSISFPESLDVLQRTSTKDADEVTNYITERLHEATWQRTRKLICGTNDGNFVLDSVSVADLQAYLSGYFIDSQFEPGCVGLVTQEISAETVDQSIRSATRCVEIMGFVIQVAGKPIVQCLGSSASTDDAFCRSVASSVMAS